MAYLIDHPPAVAQYRTRSRLTGCTVIHTAEGVMDTIGPDTGAEATAAFIAERTTYGSYHDIADSDSWLTVVPYELAAFHDATGSNDWALSISFACRTSDWRAMTTEQRGGFLRQGAQAFAAQQAWRKANGYPLTELRYITKAQSDAGESGFIEHGRRDPARRTDPGINPPDLFPYDEWLAECQAAIDGTTLQEDDMTPEQSTMLGEVHWMLEQMKPDTDRLPDEDAQTDLLLWAIADPDQGLRVQVASLQGQVAALASAMSGISGGSGLDMAVVKAAADEAASKAATAALSGLADRLKPTA